MSQHHLYFFFLLLQILLLSGQAFCAASFGVLQPALPEVNNKLNDIEFLAYKHLAWFNLADFLNQQGILQLESDTKTNIVTATAITPEPTTTYPRLIIYPSEPRWSFFPKASGVPEVDDTAILKQINSNTLRQIQNSLQSMDCLETNSIQRRTQVEASVSPIPEETTTPALKPTNPADNERVCEIFLDEPAPEFFAVYGTDQNTHELDIKLEFESGEYMTLLPAPTTTQAYQRISFHHQPRQVPNGNSQTSSASTVSDSGSASTSSESAPEPQQTNTQTPQQQHPKPYKLSLTQLMCKAAAHKDYFTLQKLLKLGVSPTEKCDGSFALNIAVVEHQFGKQRYSDSYVRHVIETLEDRPTHSLSIKEENNKSLHGLCSIYFEGNDTKVTVNVFRSCCEAQFNTIQLLLENSQPSLADLMEIFNSALYVSCKGYSEKTIGLILKYLPMRFLRNSLILSLSCIKTIKSKLEEKDVSERISDHDMLVLSALLRLGLDYSILGCSTTKIVRILMNYHKYHLSKSDVTKLILEVIGRKPIDLGSIADIFLGEWENRESHRSRELILKSFVEDQKQDLNAVLWKNKPLLNMFITEANFRNIKYAGLYHLVSYGLFPVFSLSPEPLKNEYQQHMYEKIKELQLRFFQHKTLSYLSLSKICEGKPGITTRSLNMPPMWFRLCFHKLLSDLAEESVNTLRPVDLSAPLPPSIFVEELEKRSE